EMGGWTPWWGASLFIELPPAAWFAGCSEAVSAVVLGLSPWTGSQPLSGCERAWIREPVVRSVPYIGWSDPRQLAVRAQLREGILVSLAGRQSPPDQVCGYCRDPSSGRPFRDCISEGIGQKCNNCLNAVGKHESLTLRHAD
ncbi:uncharacterized protein BP01DRAFT_399833, partial [Aspergillus saccharolyticus JOP 1030-1]